MKRIAVIDNKKIKDMAEKKKIERKCNSSGVRCVYFEGDSLRIDEDACTGMLAQICAKCAPHAIKVVNLPDILSVPVFRYGKNSFALFGIPVPVFGKVVGLIGRNGTGKSTAVKILSGDIGVQRFARLTDTDTDHYEWNADVLSKEMRLILEDIFSGKLKVSVKKQQITDVLAKSGNTTVGDYLHQSDMDDMGDSLTRDEPARDKLVRTLEMLEISDLLDRRLDVLSGGELQRVMIASASMKNSEIYIFDEPMSFLDIGQRFKVADFIRSLVDDRVSVMVIDHDMILIDYMSDLIEIFYGEESAYGMVSGVKSTKNGINEYLDGYLTAENMRIRQKALRLDPISTERKRGEIQISWSDMSRKAGDFKLDVTKGSVSKGDIIGILGKNATGKTTFAKMIAGIDTPDMADKHNISEDGIDNRIQDIHDGIIRRARISYKPQYLDNKSEATVREVLKDASERTPLLLVRLDLVSIMDRKIKDISGGELQRVAIASCLSNDADIYLLDEPSAFLDVEQRFELAKIIGDALSGYRSSLIIDHDILFIDNISNGIMVFSGEPAIYGRSIGPSAKKDGMDMFLSGLGITFRRDASGMAHINKKDSVLDREQKSQGKYYYR